MSIKVGDKAPLFSLHSTTKEEFNLEDCQGSQVVLLFFPLAFTGVCTTELCTMRDNMKKYEALNAKVIGISVDSVFTLEKFKEEQKLNFPLLSDFNKEVSRSYDSIYEEFVFGMQGVSKRAAFVISENGTIKYAEILENAGELPNFDAILGALN